MQINCKLIANQGGTMTRDKGYSTRKREKILQYLTDNCDMAVTIQDIRSYLEAEEVDVNVSTIYRYLEKLENQELVLKSVNGKREQAVFQYIGGRNECHRHLHMKCQTCGTILHLDCSFMKDITSHILEEHGFYINCKDSYLAGTCSKCMKAYYNLEEKNE